MDVAIEERELSRLKLTAEHQVQIVDLNREVDRLKKIWDETKDIAAKAKKAYEEGVNDLRDAIKEGPGDQMVFDFREKPKSEEGKLDWREVSVDQLDIPEAQRKKLREIGVNNLGAIDELETGNVDGYPEGLASIKGWGPPKVKKCRDAFQSLVAEARGPEAEPVADAAVSSDLASQSPADQENPLTVVSRPVDDVSCCETSDAEVIEEVSVVLTKTIEHMADKGFVAGAVKSGHPHGSNFVVNTDDGSPVMLMAGEFEVRQSA